MKPLIEKQFVTKNGTNLAKALIPEDYITEGYLTDKQQSEMIPFNATVRAYNPEKDIFLISSSKDIRADMSNPLLKTIVALVGVHTEAGYEKYIDPQLFIKPWAQQYCGAEIHLTAQTTLPSMLSDNPDLSQSLLNQHISLYDMFLEINSSCSSSEVSSILYRYEAKQDDIDLVVLAGMDYQCAELNYSPAALSGLENFVQNTREKLGLPSLNVSKFKNSVSDSLKGMTKDDLMKGGLIGKMLRNGKNEKPQETVKKEEIDIISEKKKADLILFGAQRKYFCLTTKEKEAEATFAFLNFVQSIQENTTLLQKETTAINNKMNMVYQQAAMNQNIAMQKQAQLRAMQAQTSQMIARNAQAASDGLKDSWNKKMASDSRISQSYSEAVRGVNSYTNSYGQNVDVSVTADHIYENRYGDVYGVSGNELDYETINNLNWTKIK